MSLSVDNAQELIARAKEGDHEALGQLLELHRPYLRVLALRYLSGPLQGRVGTSDAVQVTCLSAVRRIENFQGSTPGEFAAWLKMLHEGNVKNLVRDHVATQKRSIGREQAGNASDRDVLDSLTTPSQRAMSNEKAVALAAAIETLTGDQSTAIRLRFFDGLKLREIAERMDRSEDSISQLIRRGLARLKSVLPRDVHQ